MQILAVGGDAFNNIATGIGSIGTALALIIGGYWAYLRFRRTPESRPKITPELAAEWLELGGTPFVRVLVTVRNDGGREWLMLRGAEDDRSRVGFYSLGTADDLTAGPAGKYVDWIGLRSPDDSAPIVDYDITFQPADQWTKTVLFRPPDDAFAVLVTGLIYVKTGHREISPYDFTTVVTSMDKVKDT